MHDGFGRRFGQRRVSVPWIAGLFVLHAAAVWLVNLVVFPSGMLQPVRQATGGWVNETWLVNLAMLVLEVLVYLRGIAGVPLGDLGLRKGKVGPALAGTLLFWLALNVLQVVFGLVAGNGAAWHRDLFSRPGLHLGMLLGQLLGNALLEEVLFRGFLFVQVLLLLERIVSRRRRLVLAIALSQGLFALFHVPNRIYQGYQGWAYVVDFLGLFLLGCFFVLILVWTNNLLLAVGVHALMNAPTLLFEGGHAGLTMMAGLVLLMVLLAVLRWRSRPFTGNKAAIQSGHGRPLS